MKKISTYTQKKITAILILSIFVFSAMVGLFAPQQPASVAENEDDVNIDLVQDVESEEQNIPDPISTVSRSERGEPRADMDIGIASISDIDAENYIDHYPGKVVHMNVSIWNYGTQDISTPFEIIMHISAGTSYAPDHHDQENRTLPFALNRTVLKPDRAYNMSWNWTPPLEMPHGCEFNFSVSDIIFTARFTTVLEGDQGSNNNQMAIDIKVEQPDFDVELEPGWHIRIRETYQDFPQADPVILTIVSGQTNQFQLNFTLHNYGEATFINFSIGAPTDWKAIPPPRQYWQSKSNSSAPVPQNLSITVFPSIKLQNLPTATDLFVDLMAICESYPLAYDVLRFRVKVNFIPNPEIRPPEIEGGEVYYITPGIDYINFKVFNKGNGADNYITWADVGETSFERGRLVKDGWKAVVHSGAITRILKRGQYQVVTVKVWVPSTVRAGSPCPIKLYAKSQNGPYHKDSEKNSTFYIFADLYKDVSFEEETKSMSMYPNAESSTITKIRNTGNKVDRDIKINVTSLPEDWEVTIDSSDIPAGGLPRNGTAEIEILVATPVHVVEAKYNIRIASMSDNKIKDEIIITVQIRKIRKIAMQCKETRKFGNVSEKISYLVSIDNKGNAKDSVDLQYSFIDKEMETMDWKVVMSKNFTTLYPYESRDVIISVFIPLEALADTDFLTPKQDGYLINIIGISQNDTGVIAEKEIEVVVNPIYDFAFSKEKDKKYLTLRHTESVDYTFALSNKGNDMDWYTINASSDHDWISIPYTQRKLLPGVTEQLYIYFDPPPVLGVGTYKFTIFSRSAKDPTLKQQLELTIEIIEFDVALKEIRIGEEEIEDVNINEGETVLLRAKVENVGNLDYFVKDFLDNKGNEIPLIIKFTESTNYIGELNITFLPAGDGENSSVWVSIPWKIGKASTYQLSVVVDPNEEIPESKRDNNKISSALVVVGEDVVEEDPEEFLGMKSESIYMILGLIIVFIVIMLLGIWMTISITKRGSKKGYTVDGEYKPYEDSSKADFSKDDEEEEEPEGGVLAVHDKHPYGTKKKDKFLTEAVAFDTMKPIKKTKPIKKSKPLSSLADGKPQGLQRPQIAGYLPPKTQTAMDADANANANSNTNTTPNTGGEANTGS